MRERERLLVMCPGEVALGLARMPWGYPFREDKDRGLLVYLYETAFPAPLCMVV